MPPEAQAPLHPRVTGARTTARPGEMATSEPGRSAGSMHVRALHVDFAGGGPYRRGMDLQGQSADSVITLTAKAVEAVKQVRTREGRPEGHVLRVSVVGGGCSGFSYQLGFDEQAQAEDRILELDGVRVAIDPTSAQYLAGTQIDYVSSLHGGGFKFSNPKATHTCGCGSSFSA